MQSILVCTLHYWIIRHCADANRNDTCPTSLGNGHLARKHNISGCGHHVLTSACTSTFTFTDFEARVLAHAHMRASMLAYVRSGTRRDRSDFEPSLQLTTAAPWAFCWVRSSCPSAHTQSPTRTFICAPAHLWRRSLWDMSLATPCNRAHTNNGTRIHARRRTPHTNIRRGHLCALSTQLFACTCVCSVYDVTDEQSFNNIVNWMRQIQQHVSPIVSHDPQ